MKKHLLLLLLTIKIYSAHSQTFTDSNLPIVIIQSGGLNLDSAFTDKIVWMGIIENANSARNYLGDSCNNYNGNIAINLHGSSSLNYPKKSWKLSLLNNQLQNTNLSILGMPPENDWILDATYFDKSLLRNSLTYNLHRQMGHYSPRSRYVEVVINGDYRGIYCLTEKIKRDAYRVNVSKLWPYEITGDDVTGGYIFSLDHYLLPLDTGWFSSFPSSAGFDSSNYYLYVYPKPGGMPQVQKDYIKNFMDSFEQTMASGNYNHPDSGYYHFIEMQSFIDFFLLNELSRNTDGYRLSSYFFKDKDSKGGKLNCGPMWDYDLAYNNCQFSGGNNPSGWQFPQNYFANFIPFWWDKLFSDPVFQYELRCRYQTLRSSVLLENNMYAFIDSIANKLNESSTRNFLKWPILGQILFPAPSPAPTDYSGEVSLLKNWIQQRILWLDNHIPGQCILTANTTAESQSLFHQFPNPFEDTFTLLLKNDSGPIACKIQVFDLKGTEHFKKNEILIEKTVTEIKFDTKSIEAGIYYLRISMNENVINKIIVRH
jgi:hypothetical protein